MAKRRQDAAREVFAKPFVGAAYYDTSPTRIAQLPPLSNQMLDSLEGYIDNIAAAATQSAATGTNLAEFSATLAISVDTVAPQAKEIAQLHRQLNTLTKKGWWSYGWRNEC